MYCNDWITTTVRIIYSFIIKHIHSFQGVNEHVLQKVGKCLMIQLPRFCYISRLIHFNKNQIFNRKSFPRQCTILGITFWRKSKKLWCISNDFRTKRHGIFSINKQHKFKKVTDTCNVHWKMIFSFCKNHSRKLAAALANFLILFLQSGSHSEC